MARANQSPARILKAALRTFAEHGVAASSIQQVADRAGVSKQALLHHFRSKVALHEAVYGLLTERLRSELPSAAGDLVSRSHDRYRALLKLALERLDGEPELTRFLLFELLEAPDRVLRWLQTEGAPWLALIHAVVEHDPSSKPLDTSAHVATLGLLMLSVSALVPRKDPRWHARVRGATLQVMQLGSHLALDPA